MLKQKPMKLKKNKQNPKGPNNLKKIKKRNQLSLRKIRDSFYT